LIAAITGFGTFDSAVSASCAPPMIFVTSIGVASAISLMSAPAAKTLSPPVTTTARTPSSNLSSLAHRPNSMKSWLFKAFTLPRSSLTVAT
jgi:hypothetical protein